MNKVSKLKRISAICAAVAFALLSIFAVLVTQNRTAYKMEVPYSAKAEEAADDEERVIYPSENLFDMTLLNGYLRIYQINSNYAVNTGHTISYYCPGIVPGVYTFSCIRKFDSGTLSGASGAIALIAPNNYKYLIPYKSAVSGDRISNTVILTEEDLEKTVYFYGCADSYMSFLDITVNLGEVAYPWLPSFSYIYNKSFNEGFDVGYSTGNNEGYYSGLYDGIEQGKETGYEEGYATGKNDGYNSGKKTGYEEGKVDGYENGYTTGKNENTQSYYDKGYSDGWAASGSGTFTSLFTAVIDAPVAAFTNLLDFQILGVDMKKFALALISLALVLAIVRFVLGKS